MYSIAGQHYILITLLMNK